MGKASRIKKERQQGTQSQADFQQEASRQAKERHRQEVERHNASCGQAWDEPSKTEEMLAMQIDGKFYYGKAAISEVYTSWVRNEFARDDVANLDEIAALGQPMRCSIWDVNVEVIEMDGGCAELLDPLRATFLMEKSNCFEWLVGHACDSTEGTLALMGLFNDVVPAMLDMDAKCEKHRLATLVMERLFNLWLDAGDKELVAKIRNLGSLSPDVGEVFMRVTAQRESSRERQEIDASLTASHMLRGEESNSEAIPPSHQATMDEHRATHAKGGALRI